MRLLVLVVLGALLSFVPVRASACAGCSNPNLPVGRSSDAVPAPLTVQTSLTLSGTFMQLQHVQDCPDIGPICETGEQQPYQHAQALLSTDLVLDAEVGIIRHLSFEAIAGVRQVTSRVRFLDMAGHSYTPPAPDYHHRNETLVGPTDPWLMVHAGTKIAEWTLSGKLGVTIPLGFTVQNPFPLGRLGLPHQHIQFGTGTFDPVFAFSVIRQFEHFSVGLWTLDRMTFGTNAHGYKSGDKLLAGVQGTSNFGLKTWSFTGGADLFRESPERWDGLLEEEGNLGRTDVLIDASASWTFTKAWALVVAIKVPVFTTFQGEQAAYPAIVNVGVASLFGGT